LGAKIAETPSEAAFGAEAPGAMPADDRAAQEVLFSPGDAIQSLPAGAVHISMSAIGVTSSRRFVDAHREKQQRHLVAPV
jgi:3-hydroxyisobutyrate dehydrogenase-like beta-hydroxyacid dehydrogenase